MRLAWVSLAVYALVSVWLATARHLPPLPIVAADLVVVQHEGARRPAPSLAPGRLDCPEHRANPRTEP